MQFIVENIPNIHMWFTIGLVVAAIVAYGSELFSLELTSIFLIVILLVFFRLVPYQDMNGGMLVTTSDLLRGFSNPALMGVLSLLVLGQAVVQTGALNEVANIILRVTRNNAFLAITLSLFFVMVVSGFLNNTPVVVIFIPIMAALARGMNISVSKVMIPLSYASILGGMTTLIGSSTNLLVSGIVVDMGLPRMNFFQFTQPGMVLACVGLVYVLLVIPRLLPDRTRLSRSYAGDNEEERQFVGQFAVDYSSDFVGQKLVDDKLSGYSNVNIRMVQRGEHAFLPPFDDQMVLRPRDTLVMAAPRAELSSFFSKNIDTIEHHLAIIGDDEEENPSDGMIMAEAVVSPSSKLVGKNLEQASFRSVYNCVVLGIERQSRVMRSKLTEMRLAAGDVLLITGKREDILALHDSKDFLLMEWSTEDIHSGKKAGLTMAIFAGVVSMAAFNILPIAVAALAGVAAILATGCLNLQQAGRALDMKIILTIGASIALGTALETTGGASYVAHGFIGLFDGASILIILSALFFVMAALTNVLSNNAAAVLFTPIAVNLAIELGIDPFIFIYAVVFACNCSFITPIGYQTNLMVMSPGHYKFSDYIRSGLPLAIIVWLAYIIYVKMHYGL